jgi:hypothetical protein
VAAAFDNVAIATGRAANGTDVSATDTAHVTVTEPIAPPAVIAGRPSIAITKNPKSQKISRGGTAVFTITVKNTGDVELTSVTVSDPKSRKCDRALGTMAAGASVTYTCTKPKVTASFDNVAVATGSAGATSVSATDSAPVKVAALEPPKRTVNTKKPKKHPKPPKVVTHKKPKVTG